MKELLTKHMIRVTVVLVGLLVIVGVYGYLTSRGSSTAGFSDDLRYFGQIGSPTVAALAALWKSYDNHHRLDDANDKLEIVKKQTNGALSKQQDIVQNTIPPVVDSVKALETQVAELTKQVADMRTEHDAN
jgi:hypothetical protein